MILNLMRNWYINVVNRTASRALNTEYTNTTGRSMFVSCSVYLIIVTGADSADATASVDSVASASCSIGTGSSAGTYVQNLNFVVPPGKTYRVDKIEGTAGQVLLNIWTESN